MEEILCACGAKMKKIGRQTAALAEENAAAMPDAEKVTVDIYECEECGAVTFYRVED